MAKCLRKTHKYICFETGVHWDEYDHSNFQSILFKTKSFIHIWVTTVMDNEIVLHKRKRYLIGMRLQEFNDIIGILSEYFKMV